MNDGEIRATVGALIGNFRQLGWTTGPVRESHEIVCEVEAAKLLAEMLVNFGRLVDAVEVLASCAVDTAERIDEMTDAANDAALEAARPEGTC